MAVGDQESSEQEIDTVQRGKSGGHRRKARRHRPRDAAATNRTILSFFRARRRGTVRYGTGRWIGRYGGLCTMSRWGPSMEKTQKKHKKNHVCSTIQILVPRSHNLVSRPRREKRYYREQRSESDRTTSTTCFGTLELNFSARGAAFKKA